MYGDVIASVLDTRALPHQTDGPGLVMGNMPARRRSVTSQSHLTIQTGNYLIEEHHWSSTRLEATEIDNKAGLNTESG